MRKPVIWIVCYLISFYSCVSLAGDPTVVIDNQPITLPSYEGFEFTADPNSPVFKKLTELYSTKDSTTFGFYYETRPIDVNRIIRVSQAKNAKPFLSKGEWKILRKQLIKEALNPVITKIGNTKTEKVLVSSLPQNKYHLVFVWDVRFYTMGEDRLYTYQSSILEARDYVYLNGKLIAFELSMNALKPDVKLNTKPFYAWIVTTFDATSEQLFELNKPTKTQLSLERKAQIQAIKEHWIVSSLVFLGLIVLGWKFYTTWWPKIVEQHRARTQSKRR